VFTQSLDPTGHLWLTVLVALVPLFTLIVVLTILRITAWLAIILVSVVTLPLSVLVWHAPLLSTLKSYLLGSLTGVWSIDWITFWGLMIFNTLVLSGQFDRFKAWMLQHATTDIRIQTLLFAWSFGALLEGLVGFGVPWAVVVPILVGLGVKDLEAIRVAALANNAPVSFGALGAPIIGLAAVTNLPLLSLSASIGDIVAVLALLPPWILVYLVSGWSGVRETWPLQLIASLAFIAGQWPVAHYFGPYLPDVAGALLSFWVLLLFVKLWQPKTLRGVDGGLRATPLQSSAQAEQPLQHALQAWSPYLVLILVVIAWTGPWSSLPTISLFRWSIAARSSVTHEAIRSVFNFTPMAGGTSILVAWLLILLLLRTPAQLIPAVFARTFKQIWGAWLVAFFIFGLAYVFVFAGMANSLAYGLSKLGPFFIVFAPILGWIGVALSGSNTSTNAMFGPVQAVTGRLLNLPVLLLPSLNSVGAEVGKPIAPQTASVGVATSRLVRSEGQVIRHNMGWTLVLLLYLILIALLFRYAFPGAMAR
jgi:lactate permease